MAAARIVLIATDEPETERRLLLCAKNNLAAFPSGLGFSLQQTTIPKNIVTSRVVWDGEPVTISANEAVSATGARGLSKLQGAVQWLHRDLSDGPKPAIETIDKAKREGIAKRTLDRAREELDVVVEKSAFHGEWRWSLP